MEILNAKLVAGSKSIIGGVYIDLISKDNIIKDSYVKLELNHIIHYFKITDISIDGENLKLSAVEDGYWSIKFDRNSNFDLRNLIGLSVTIVDDPKTIRSIYEMSLWC